MNFTPAEQVQWKTVQFLERLDETFEYEFQLPRPLADWDVFAAWERVRFHSMRERLVPGDTLFDVGTEQGWCNLIYATFVGPESMVLIEPTPEFWPNIRATWERNYSVPPRACYAGLLGTEVTDLATDFSSWPAASTGPLIDRNKYQYLHEHAEQVGQLTIDALVTRSGVVPRALTIDVEGAELMVLQGAEATLADHRPLLWISVHPDLMERHCGQTDQMLHEHLAFRGYTGVLLGTDHEQHWFYQP